MSKLRRALGPGHVVTVPGSGCRLEPQPRRIGGVDPVPARPLSVIVLPFVDSAPDGDASPFADAPTDDVTIELARIRGSSVIAHPAARTLRDRPAQAVALAAELGVRALQVLDFARRHAPQPPSHSRFARVSRDSRFLRLFRERVFAPLVRGGLCADMGFADEWEARQRAGAAPDQSS